MKKVAFILVLFLSSMGWAQNFIVTERPADKSVEAPAEEEKADEGSVEEFNALINYTPKAFVPNEKTKPQNRMLAGNLNSISSLELRYAYQEQMKLSPQEVKWLESEIDQLSIAFFADGKPMIIKKTGGYEGCTGQRVSTENRNGYDIKTMYFCYTCKGASEFEDRFIEIFNKRTEKLIAFKKK
ncbi:MAG: hypothetical protein QM710_11230 [Flavobacterium sp.]